MTWSWISFLIGAPLWGSVAVVIFAAATRVRVGRVRARPSIARAVDTRESRSDVVSLAEYRRSRMRRPASVLHGAAWRT